MANRLTRPLIGLAWAIAWLVTGSSVFGGKTSSVQSLRQWAKCDGKTDDAQAVAEAFAAAGERQFTLEVDCPAFIHIGTDISRPVFIYSNTTVVFKGAGEFIVDNSFLPAFVIANSHGVVLINWRIKYAARVPVDPRADGFYVDGKFISHPGPIAPQSNFFNDVTLKNWLMSVRNIAFDNANPLWTGPVATGAILYFRGSASDVLVSGMRLFVEESAQIDEFIPIAVSFNLGPQDNVSMSAHSPVTAESYATPSRITFRNIDFDGTYMGWLGSVQDSTFEHIRSHRYGDLQDSRGGDSGGRGKWFPPPHLFYLNYDPNRDIRLINRNIQITDVLDYGIRIGLARDVSTADSRSGNAVSLKIGGENISIDNYVSNRPDGFLDLLTSHTLTLRNALVSYDSSFLHSLYPALRFPGPVGSAIPSYVDIQLENIKITDRAAATDTVPMVPFCLQGTRELSFRKISFFLGKWADPAFGALRNSSQQFCGAGNRIFLHYNVIDPTTLVRTQFMSEQLTHP